jgi:ribonuclease HI
MELTAAIQALQALKRPCQVELFTDSEYLRRGITEWLAGWKARGWRRKEGPLANADLWQALDAVQARHQVEWHWLRGHAGQPANERVDQLARDAIRKYSR